MRDKPLRKRKLRRVRKALTARFPGAREWLVERTAQGVSAAVRRRLARVNWSLEGEDHALSALERGPVVFVCWHESLLIAPFFLGRLPAPVASIHDASPAGRIGEVHAGMLGLRPFNTHTSWEPRSLLRDVRNGGAVALAADGPSGPARIAKPAAVDWARATGAQVVLFAAGTRSESRLPSWDRMLWPGGSEGLASFAPGPASSGRGPEQRERARLDLQSALTRHADDVQRRAKGSEVV